MFLRTLSTLTVPTVELFHLLLPLFRLPLPPFTSFSVRSEFCCLSIRALLRTFPSPSPKPKVLPHSPMALNVPSFSAPTSGTLPSFFSLPYNSLSSLLLCFLSVDFSFRVFYAFLLALILYKPFSFISFSPPCFFSSFAPLSWRPSHRLPFFFFTLGRGP